MVTTSDGSRDPSHLEGHFTICIQDVEWLSSSSRGRPIALYVEIPRIFTTTANTPNADHHPSVRHTCSPHNFSPIRDPPNHIANLANFIASNWAPPSDALNSPSSQ
ncbi:hypothetical protein PDE_01355 [Penicillium oxalicum 114-2]|uniref:Uncharacterized protein n=1 Tax=Penicillium oxalicum (strain 114-2 / CGMCC 5302) TaxID=933388 RepID=S7Z8A9_PENO1|nr:hypothetical protein PDE_01355 [Penicillium oxalicum 114-2]